MRCYFHLVSGQDVILDDTGVDVPDPGALPPMALRLIREIQQEADEPVTDWQNWRIDVTDPSGRVLLSLPLRATIQ